MSAPVLEADGLCVALGARPVLDRVTLRAPDGRVLLRDACAVVREGDRVLIQGASGCGKSTLFRATAGLWPWGEGLIRMPAPEATTLLPQRPRPRASS